MRDMLRSAFSMLRSGRLVVLHLIGNASLLVAAALWLLVGETHVSQLIFAAVAALAIVFLALWLHTGTIEFAVNPVAENFRPSFRLSFLRMFWLLLGMAILFWLMFHAARWQEDSSALSGYLYAKAPKFLRPVKGEGVYDEWLDRGFSALFWFVLPGVFLPLIAARVLGSRLRAALKTLIRWQYWTALAVLVVVGVWIPQLLAGWVPFKKLGPETASLITRLSVAYMIAVFAWLLVVGLLGYFVRVHSQDFAGEPVA